jgi:hypothetical protein
VKNIDFEDDFDPLLSVAESGYDPKSPKEVLDDLIMNIPKDFLATSAIAVSDINNITNPTAGQVIYETSTNKVFIHNGNNLIQVS